MNKKRYDWPTLIEECSSSGLSGSAFCRKHGLPMSSFHKAKKRLEVKSCSKTLPRQNFIEVTPVSEALGSPLQPTPTLRITSKDGHVVEVYL